MTAPAADWRHFGGDRIHGTIRVTPAMEAKITDHVWDLAELLAPSSHVATCMIAIGS